MSTVHASRYNTPLSATSSSTSLPSTSSNVPPKPKPTNVFSDDGSFLERFQRSKKDEEDKRKAELEILLKKRQFSDRFRNRGKRLRPDSSPPVTSTDPEGNSNKKAKVEDPPLANYQREVKDYAGRSLKDSGTGVRPLVR